jgi:sugar phosphate isomerase/epimerase
MKGILCSTGVFNRKELSADVNELISIYPKLCCDGYELMLSGHWIKEQVAQCTDFIKAGVKINLAHLSKRIGSCFSSGSEESLSEAYDILHMNSTLLSSINVTQAVIHLWGYPDSNFDYVLKGYKEAVSICASYGIEILAETLPCREKPVFERMKQLADINPSCRYTIDTRHLKYNDLTERIFEENWLWSENRVAHVHISDCKLDDKGKTMIEPLHPGEGIIDFSKFFKNLSLKCYSNYITLESPAERLSNKIDLTKVNSSLIQIRKYCEETDM